MLTDGCLYTETYLKDEKDVEQLLQYFWRLKSGEGSPSEGSLHAPSRVAAKVLAACLLPNQERDLVQVFKIDELVKAGVKLKEAGRNAVEKEAIAARLVSLQLQDAAAELQLLKETYWLMLVDPMTLEQEDLDERLHTYKEVLCSGIQDKQRELKASYLGLFSTAAGTTTTAGTATSAPGEEEVPSRGRQNTFSLLQPGDRQPSEELAALLKQLSADRQAAERLSASFQEAIHAMKTSSTTSTSGGNGSSSSKWERAMKPMIEGVVGELMRLAADKTEAEKTQLLHEVVRLAGQAHAEVQASTEATGPTSSSSRAAAVRRRQKQQQGTQLLELLQDRCLQRGKIAASGAVRPADRLVVYGLEDVEEMVAPFFLPSLRSSRRSSSNSSSSRSSREDALMIDRSLDVDSPIVLDIAARKGSLEEQRQFINAVWWAVKKETLLAETNKSFRCPRTPEGDHTHTDGYPCNWEELQETIQLLLNKLQRQLESLWGELGPFFTARMRAFGVVGLDIESAAANADCRMVYNELQPLQELVSVQNKWMVKDKLKKREAPNSRRHREISPPWAHTEPTCINPPNAAAAAAVAAAAAAAAAATGVPQQTIQQRYYHTDKPRTVRNEDWS
ncbi:hypothetical protein, conserved [Eimeria maxima]|uniref:Uncharacterized protein n=1 Tax=Eimeria maxima TaxID=5804 RepID=U6M6X4_EIMMA|nr:hypothetical protein, conserved [Eimeria maxima]CDJ58813.1 hypothetical protein, conserved [Eimeria maxima]